MHCATQLPDDQCRKQLSSIPALPGGPPQGQEDQKARPADYGRDNVKKIRKIKNFPRQVQNFWLNVRNTVKVIRSSAC